MFTDLKYRMRALFRRAAVERELEEELRFHLEQEIAKHQRAGLTRAAAERRAKLEFGGVERIKEDTRDARGVNWLESVLQDVRYGWRALRARPGFSLAVVLTLGLGVGANTAMFGVVDRLLFRPPAYLQTPERVHRTYLTYWLNGREHMNRHTEYRRYRDIAELTSSFDVVAAFAYRTVAIGTGDAAREYTIAAVSASLFDLFEVRPELGRLISAADDREPAGERVAVLGYGYWQTVFGGRPEVLGQQLHVGNVVYTVVGVAPRHFVGITEGPSPAVFVPVTALAHARTPTYGDNYNWGWLELVARRRAGVSEAAADADMDQAFARSWERERELSPRLPVTSEARTRGQIASIHLGRGPQADASAKIVAWVMGVAGIVLLIACANVINLLLARAVHRRREIALRLALGVTRARLLQQLLAETLLLALLGGAVGLLAAQWGGSALRALFLREEDVGAVANDTRTLFFTAAVTLGLALLTGLAPALQALRADVAAALKAGMRDSAYRRSRLRTGLLLFQGALSVILLVGAGLFVQSLANVRAVRLGYDVDPVVLVAGNLRGERLTPAQLDALVGRIFAAAEAVPGVQSVTTVESVPFWSYEGRGAPYVPGVDSVAKLGQFVLQAGSARYFETAGTRILRGRGFTEQDRAGSQPIIVVNEAMANALWPGQDPIGRQLRIGPDSLALRTVVGVAESMRAFQQGDEAGQFWYYLPVDQYRADFGDSSTQLLVRVNGNADDYVEAIRKRLQPEMPGAGYITTTSLRSVIAPQQRAWEFGATMFVAFGALALVLAAIGLYSVSAYTVAQRTRELGVRIALGASVGAVVRLIAGQGILFASVGILAGSAAAVFAGRWIQPLLFGASAYDVSVYVAVGGILLLVAAVATVRPAIRAARVDPTVTLRAD